MESKTRLWRRKHSEKNITKERILELEISLKNLNEQLSSARNESDAKDDLIGKQEKKAQEAIAGWEKAEAEAVSFKQEFDDALYQKAIAEEKVASIDAALKDCVQQLHTLKNEQQRAVSDATVNMLHEREKTLILEERLANANKRIHQLSIEKSNLCGILDMQEKFIKDLNVSKSQSEADFAAIVERFDFSEKNNESLKYEVLMLQKELVLRHQEREFNLRSAESAQKQHLENVRKINRLESECHRLRVMVRKRLPGPAAISKMRSEVEMLGNCVPETRRNSNSTMDSSPRDFAPDIGHGALSKQVVRLNGIEDENKILKETLKKKNSELQLSRIMFARTASKLSQTEKQLKELSKGPTCPELARSSSVTCELPLASVSEDCGNEDDVSCAESWASALMSQLEHFRQPATPFRAIGSSQSSLMDDFDEMEKLSIIYVDKPGGGSSTISGEDIACLTPKTLDLKPELLESMGKELVLLGKSSDSCELGDGDQSSFTHYEKYPSWLQDILKVILQKHYTMQLNLDVILRDVRVALSKNKKTVKGKPLDPLLVPHHCSFNSGNGSLGMKNFLPSESGNQLLQLNLEKALYRIIELIEGFIWRAMPHNDRELLISLNDQHIDPQHKPASSTRQTTCIFLWESSELTMVLQRFITACNNMLFREAEVEKFVSELASILGWIIDHCFSLQDISAMEETIKKHFGDHFSVCDDDAEVEFNSPKGANYKTDAHDNFKVILGKPLPSSTVPDDLYILSKMDIIGSKHRDENRKLKHKITNVESGKKDLEEKLKSASAKNHSLFTMLQESEKCISDLQAELKKLKYSRGLVEEQIEDQKLISEDLGTQLTVANVELSETHQMFSSLEAELEEKSNYCEELEATCLELQLQIESVSAKDIPKFDMVPEEKEVRTDWEISAASEKLAECQETILQLGKRLKALASPKDSALVDNVISSSAITRASPSPQLLEQLIAMDNSKFEDLKSPQTKEIICSEPQNPQLAETPVKTDAGFLNGQKSFVHFVSKNQESSIRHALLAKSTVRPHELGTQKCGTEIGVLVSIPKKQKGGIALLKKLLSRKKKESNKKLILANGSFSTLSC